MLICPACSFQEEYQPGYRVGTLRPCGRCGLYSLLYLCSKCKIIGLRKSTISTACACGSMQEEEILSLEIQSKVVAFYVGVGTFLILWAGYYILEAPAPQKPRSILDDYLKPLEFLFTGSRLLDYGVAAVVNAGLAWVVSLVVYRAKGRKYLRELSDSFNISNSTITATKVEPINYATPKKSTPLVTTPTEPISVEPTPKNWLSTQTDEDQKLILLLVKDYVKHEKISGGYSAIAELNSKNPLDWNFDDHSRFDEFRKTVELAEKFLIHLDPEGGKELAFKRILEISYLPGIRSDYYSSDF